MALGPVMMDLEGTTLTEEEREMLQHPQVGGVLLFTRNYEDNEQLKALTQSIREARESRLLIAVDHEGGRVQRFRSGFTKLPAAACVGQIYDKDPKKAARVATELGWLMAVELLQHDVDISFAPVLDIDYEANVVIGKRSFHRDPEAVARLGQAYITGMKQAGMAATGKHFPGHGAVREDSHFERPVDPRPLAELMMSDILPFERIIAHGDLAGIMPAHIIYSAIDDKPAGYSKRWLNDILRQQLGFQGVIFSDDLGMAAANLGECFADRSRLALDSGCDMVLVCNDPDAAAEVLESLQDYSNPVSQSRLVRMHGKCPASIDETRLKSARNLAAALLDDPNLELNI